jgi:hypothetical protein
MLHHHFPQLISPFHDGFVSGRDVAEFVRANPATKAIISHHTAPPAPTTRGRDILMSILIHDQSLGYALVSSDGRKMTYRGERPGARFQMLRRVAPQNEVEGWSAIFSCIFVDGAARRASRRSNPSSYKRRLLRSTLSKSSELWSAAMSGWPRHNHSSRCASIPLLFP